MSVSVAGTDAFIVAARAAPPRRRRLAHLPWTVLLVACLALAACGQVVQYTDELVDPRTGRSSFVTVPANAGGFVGFFAGIPVDVAALPVSWPLYEVQRRRDPTTADPVSTMLFPSFVLWRAGTMLAMPFDAMEWAVWRAWQPPTTRTAEEQAQIEYDLDEETLPRYPVEPIYPLPSPGEDATTLVPDEEP